MYKFNINRDLLDISTIHLLRTSGRTSMESICYCANCECTRKPTIHGTCETCGSASIHMENTLDKITVRYPKPLFDFMEKYLKNNKSQSVDIETQDISRWLNDGGK